MIPALPAYLLSAGLGLAAAAGILSAVAAQTVPPARHAGAAGLSAAADRRDGAVPAGLRACTGRWRGWRFWAAAIPLSAVIWGAALMALLGGHASWQAALGVAAVGHVAAGLAALSLTRGRVA
ncbi:hypothetical protein F1642_03565 [Paracoccus sp. NBH48]|uniref:hypothetical protein n=1 Tax=Paracoccus sp. NBH48 TaxID=2596918 RepID=UPI001891EE3D|nr:hypothetical protein [Paracoccus sp. NBH48]MBF5078287.1 hypothetical protein [Paracoccus sp. NBH48]